MTALLTRLLGDTPGLVAFDLDGTLVDSVPDIALAVDQMRTELGMALAGEAAVRHWVGNGAELLVKRALADSLDPDRVAAISDQQMARAMPLFKQFYKAANGRSTKVYDGVETCLNALFEQDIPLAVVTNKPKQFTDPLLEMVGMARFFTKVIGGDCFPEKKPSPVALNFLSAAINVDPGTSLMVGDSKHDVGAARAAGFKALCVSYGYNHGEPIAASQPDAIVDSLVELVV